MAGAYVSMAINNINENFRYLLGSPLVVSSCDSISTAFRMKLRGVSGRCSNASLPCSPALSPQTKESPAQTRPMRSVPDLDLVRAVIDCEGPRPDLYKFVGTMLFHNAASGAREQVPLGPEHVLLRGSRLKNTTEIYGTCHVSRGRPWAEVG